MKKKSDSEFSYARRLNCVRSDTGEWVGLGGEIGERRRGV